MNLGAFAVIAALQKRTGRDVVARRRSPASGRKEPLLGILMTLFLLSLTGIPPTAGFFAKAYVILAAVEAGGPLTILAVIAVLNAAVAAFYYLRVVVYMYMRDPASDAPRPPPRRAGLGRPGRRHDADDRPRALPDRRCSTSSPPPRRRSRRARPRAPRRPRARRAETGQEPRRPPAPNPRARSASALSSAGAGRSRPWTATVHPDQAAVARARRRTASNASTSLSSSPSTTTAPGRSPGQQPLDRLALAAGVTRPQIHDGSPAIVLQAVVDRGRRAPRRAAIAATTAARAAATSSAWRTWNATDGPLRSTNSQPGWPSSRGDAAWRDAPPGRRGPRSRARS